MNNEEAMQIAKDAAKAGHDAFVQSLASHGLSFTVANVTLKCYMHGDPIFTVSVSPALDEIICSNLPGTDVADVPCVWKRYLRVYYRTEDVVRNNLSCIFYQGDDEGVFRNFNSIESVSRWIAGVALRKVDEYIVLLNYVKGEIDL